MPVIRAADGCDLYFETGGEGRDAVLFIPGLGGDGRFWSGVLGALSPSIRHIVVDHRGAGRCGRPEGPYLVDLIARDVVAVLDHLREDSVHMVGHSTGGLVAQTLAIDHPSRISSLVVSASWEKADQRFRTLFGARRAMIEAGLFEDYQALTQVLGYDFAYMESHASALAQDRKQAAQRLKPASVTAARIDMLLDFDRSADLHRITAPTMVIGSREDMMVPFHHSMALAKAIPAARLARMRGGHFYPVTSPEAMARLVHGHVRLV
jgi:aminoacrylate hydrolase